MTETVPVWPEQIVLAPHAGELGLIVSVPKIGAALTVTVAEAFVPSWLRTVISTTVSLATFAGSKTIVPVEVSATGRIAVLLDTTK